MKDDYLADYHLSLPPNELAPQLSPRQARILQEVALGNGDMRIALRLGISTSTVRYYLQQVFSLLDVDTRTSAVIKAYHSHLLEVSQPIIEWGNQITNEPSLTPFQLEILSLTRENGDQKIAKILKVEVRNIQYNLRWIYANWNVPNRKAAVMKAYQLGLLGEKQP